MLVSRCRGGYCWEQNTLLQMALEEIDWAALHASLAPVATGDGGVRVRSVQLFAAAPQGAQCVVSPPHLDDSLTP